MKGFGCHFHSEEKATLPVHEPDERPITARACARPAPDRPAGYAYVGLQKRLDKERGASYVVRHENKHADHSAGR